MIYDHHVVIAVPVSELATAVHIGRALDPDSGGADSFNIRATHENGTQYAVVSTPCRLEFAQQAVYLMAHPAECHQSVLTAYSERHPDITPPTLADISSFTAKATLAVDTSLDAALGSLGLTRVIPSGA